MWDWPASGDTTRVWAIDQNAFGFDTIVLNSGMFQPVLFAGQYQDQELTARNNSAVLRRPGLANIYEREYDPFLGGGLQFLFEPSGSRHLFDAPSEESPRGTQVAHNPKISFICPNRVDTTWPSAWVLLPVRIDNFGIQAPSQGSVGPLAELATTDLAPRVPFAAPSPPTGLAMPALEGYVTRGAILGPRIEKVVCVVDCYCREECQVRSGSYTGRRLTGPPLEPSEPPQYLSCSGSSARQGGGGVVDGGEGEPARGLAADSAW